MAYYSFVVHARCPLNVPGFPVVLGTGFNVFTLTTENVEEFLEALRKEDVRIDQVNRLDDFTSVGSESFLLPGEGTSPAEGTNE